jgi:hypothetical protein
MFMKCDIVREDAYDKEDGYDKNNYFTSTHEPFPLNA